MAEVTGNKMKYAKCLSVSFRIDCANLILVYNVLKFLFPGQMDDSLFQKPKYLRGLRLKLDKELLW